MAVSAVSSVYNVLSVYTQCPQSRSGPSCCMWAPPTLQPRPLLPEPVRPSKLGGGRGLWTPQHPHPYHGGTQGSTRRPDYLNLKNPDGSLQREGTLGGKEQQTAKRTCRASPADAHARPSTHMSLHVSPLAPPRPINPD